jgi:hypothetical protein
VAAMKTVARKQILDTDEEWGLVCALLPDGWREKAKELGAVRRLRGIGSVETLLRILFVHLADGCSLKETSVRVGQLGWAGISPVALLKRLRQAERWLSWMAQQLRGSGAGLGTDRVCVAVDATTVTEPGPTGSLWRVHWCVNLSSLRCEFFEVTDTHGGEKFARFPIAKDQLVMGDRGYSMPGGIDYVREQGGHVLVRVNSASLPLYRDKGQDKKMNVLSRTRGMKVGEIRAWPAWVRGSEGRWHKGRLVAVKRSLSATRRELRRWRRNTKSRHRKLTPRVKAMARYVLVWTSLAASEAGGKKVMRCYRARWQLELVFKRAKSIMGLGQLPKYSDASSRAWLSGKLLVAMLVEKLWQKAEHFSPWGYALPKASQPVA